MSVSTPRPINSLSLSSRLLQGKSGAAVFGWSLSALLHLGAITALLSIGLHSPPAPTRASAERNAALPVDTRTVEARRHVAELRQTEKELTETRDRRQAQYSAWIRQRLENAPYATQQALKNAAEAQKQAAAAQSEASQIHQKMAEIPKLTAEPVIPMANRALNRMEKARSAQAEALRAQDEALANLEIVHPADPQIAQAITEARQKQIQAQEAQKKAAEIQAQIAQLQPKTRDGFVEAEKLKKVFESVKNDPQAGPKALTHFNQVGSDAMAMWGTLKNLRQTAPLAQKAAEQAQTAADQAQQNALETASRQLPHKGGQEHGPEGNGGSGFLGSHANGPAASPSGNGQTADGKGNPPPGANGSKNASAPSSSAPVAENRSLPELYADAVASEQRSAEAYRQIRAANRAMIEGIPLERALQETEYAPPLRPTLNSPPASGLMDLLTGSTPHQEETETAQQQIASMNALGHRLLSRVQAEHNDREGATIRQEWVQGRAAQQAQLQALAQQDGQQAKDLTAALRGLPGETANPATRSAKERELRPSPPSLPPPIPAGVDIKAIAGRKVLPGALASAWMFVDSWYTLGPFPNPQRANMNKSFPPEQGIDLDAAYRGKDNRTLRWKFVQSGGPMVVPADAEEYGVYYAYTELWFDRPRDLWIAVGSDDKSTVWIEDQLVWISSDVLKGWRVDEGLRKVHFKKGLNRIVYRLENGWRGMGLSLVICLKPAP